jgi:hypothetical protein
VRAIAAKNHPILRCCTWTRSTAPSETRRLGERQRADARADIFECIEASRKRNRQRRHSTLGYLARLCTCLGFFEYLPLVGRAELPALGLRLDFRVRRLDGRLACMSVVGGFLLLCHGVSLTDAVPVLVCRPDPTLICLAKVSHSILAHRATVRRGYARRRVLEPKRTAPDFWERFFVFRQLRRGGSFTLSRL